MKKLSIKQVVTIAVMASLSTIFDLMLAKGTIKISIHALPLIISGIIYGPFIGLLTGVVTGFISQIFTYGLSITTPFWLLAYASWGLISGLFNKTIKNKMLKEKNINNCVIACVIFSSLFAFLSNTLASFSQIWLMNDPYYTKASIITDLLPRFLIMFVMIFAHSILVSAILKSLDKKLKNE